MEIHVLLNPPPPCMIGHDNYSGDIPWKCIPPCTREFFAHKVFVYERERERERERLTPSQTIAVPHSKINSVTIQSYRCDFFVQKIIVCETFSTHHFFYSSIFFLSSQHYTIPDFNQSSNACSFLPPLFLG